MRSCGACTLCCTLQGVKELPDGTPKPPGQPCPHAGPGGCGIYDSRPEECRDYTCLWLEGFAGPLERPDRIGALAESQTVPEGTFVVVRALRAGPAVQKLVRKARERGGRCVVVTVDTIRRAFQKHGWMLVVDIDEEAL